MTNRNRLTKQEKRALRAIHAAAALNGFDFALTADVAFPAKEFVALSISLQDKGFITVHDPVTTDSGTWTQITLNDREHIEMRLRITPRQQTLVFSAEELDALRELFASSDETGHDFGALSDCTASPEVIQSLFDKGVIRLCRSERDEDEDDEGEVHFRFTNLDAVEQALAEQEQEEVTLPPGSLSDMARLLQAA